MFYNAYTQRPIQNGAFLTFHTTPQFAVGGPLI